MLTSKECLEKIGDPSLEKEMITMFVPPELQIHSIPRKIYCNKRMPDHLIPALRALVATGAIGELKTWDGCFNIRNKKRGSTPSLHSWGLAVDLNAAWNKQGTIPTFTPTFVACFINNGFDWGGNWKGASCDGMHFQLKSL